MIIQSLGMMASQSDGTTLFSDISVIDADDDESRTEVAADADHLRIDSDAAPDRLHILAIFVVTFDTRSGNMIEWCLPPNIDLEGVEFKSLPSGSHKLRNDFVYFKLRDDYGISCYEKLILAHSEVERGARMKSVGVIASSFEFLHLHKPFLEDQVRYQLQHPGDFSSLEAYFNQNNRESLANSRTISSQSEILSSLTVSYPSGSFSHFIKFFSENIFVIWKFVLLKRRILFFSPPPIGVVCYKVYCAQCLGIHGFSDMADKREVTPYFYINVADISTLEKEKSTIMACTTEKIFENKTSLYDVYVDNQNIGTHIPSLQPIARANVADKERFNKLTGILRSCPASSTESCILSFFTQLNTLLFQTLFDASLCGDRSLTSESFKELGLDPVGDRLFLEELADLYGIDVTMIVDNVCCPMTVI